MSDTNLDVSVPATSAMIRSGNHGHYGLTEKDQSNINKDVSNANFNNLLNAVNDGASASELATSVASGALGVSIATTSAAGQLTTNVASQQIQNTLLSEFNNASVQAQTFNAQVQLLAVQNASAAALTAATNAAAIQAANAECCCEIKTLIISDGQKTRDLVNSINASNLAIQLVDAKNEVTLLKLKSNSVTS